MERLKLKKWQLFNSLDAVKNNYFPYTLVYQLLVSTAYLQRAGQNADEAIAIIIKNLLRIQKTAAMYMNTMDWYIFTEDPIRCKDEYIYLSFFAQRDDYELAYQLLNKLCQDFWQYSCQPTKIAQPIESDAILILYPEILENLWRLGEDELKLNPNIDLEIYWWIGKDAMSECYIPLHLRVYLQENFQHDKRFQMHKQNCYICSNVDKFINNSQRERTSNP